MAQSFEYTPFNPAPYAASVAELLAHQNDAAARSAVAIAQANAHAREVSGQAWAGAAQNIGRTVAAIPEQIQQAKSAALDTRYKTAQIGDIEAQATQRAVAAKKQQALDQQNAYIDQVMSKAMKDDPDTGVKTFDRPTFETGLMDAGLGHLYPSLSETLDKLDASASKRNAESRVMLAHGLIGIEKAGYTPESVLSTAAYLKANGVIKAEQLLPVQEALADDPSPENIKRIVETLAQNNPQYQAEKDRTAKTDADLAKTKADTDKAAADAEKLRSEAIAGPKRTEAEQGLDAYAKSIGKTKAEELTYLERQTFDKNKAAITASAEFQKHINERNYDNAHPAPVKDADQGKLEQQYRTVLARAMSSRSGGIGAEDAKVQQANHLLSLLHQTYDPNTDSYSIPKTLQGELAAGLARLVAPGGSVGIEMMREFDQRTAKGDIAGALSYVTGHPFPTATQDFAKLLKDSIERQGNVAQDNREGEMRYLRGLAPTELEESRRQALEANTLNPLRQSRVAVDAQGQKKLFVSTDGGKTWK